MNPIHDFRVALRSLLRAPAFMVTSLLIVGLGIGMASAMTTVFNAVLLRPLPVHEQDRIVIPRVVDQGGTDIPVVPSELEAIARGSRTMQAVAGADHRGAMVFPLMEGDRSLVLAQALVTGNFFDVMGARPALGRLLHVTDDVRGAAPAMVISYRAWQQEFGGDPEVIGRRVTEPVFQTHYSIVGVAPAGLDYPVGADYWVPAEPLGGTVATVVARLAPGATPAAARAEFLTLMRESPRRRASPNQLAAAQMKTIGEAIAGDVRPVLIVLVAAVSLLLLIACVNVANLLLLRTASRARELAVRRALGASAGTLLRHLLAESGLLAVGGGALGLAIAAGLVRGLLVLAPGQLPRMDVIGLSGTPVVAALAITLMAVLLFGVVPGVIATRSNLAPSLRLDGRSGRESRGHGRLRHWLVASQVALAIVLLAGAGLLSRSLARLDQLELGFRTEHLSIIELVVPRDRARSRPAYLDILDAVHTRLRTVPGVTGVTSMLVPPFVGANIRVRQFAVEGQSAEEAKQNPFVAMEGGGADYFRTLGIPLVRGRSFTDADREDSPPTAVVSESVARRFWPRKDPVGQRILGLDGDTIPRTVVGVARDVHLRTLRESTPTVYLPWRQSAAQGYVAVRTMSDLATILPAMRRSVQEVDPQVTLWRGRSMDDLLAAPMARPRLSAWLLSGFGAVALLLAMLGLYGVMSSVVREQTREIGVRMALGATPGRVRRDVLGRALAVCAVGSVVGVAAALASSRLYTTLLFEVSPTDPTALFGACGVLLGIALVAAYLPARRATRIHPSEALRMD